MPIYGRKEGNLCHGLPTTPIKNRLRLVLVFLSHSSLPFASENVTSGCRVSVWISLSLDADGYAIFLISFSKSPDMLRARVKEKVRTKIFQVFSSYDKKCFFCRSPRLMTYFCHRNRTKKLKSRNVFALKLSFT